ncbi:MAG: hypothetical protein IJE29_05415 [Firmicutes bacterium]|nr:hypothetical protein [Bacillota bacterium]MBQ3199211.1 hypothetical protein [Bacillota bacterium]
MNKLLDLQQKADEYLVVNPAALQILLQMQINCLRLQQSLLAAANTCGCAKLGTDKLPLPENADWKQLKALPTGDDLTKLCPNCRLELQERLGALLFYAAALANTLNFDLTEICDREIDKLDLLGYFMMQ